MQLPLQLVVFHQEPQDWRGCANCLITHKKEKKNNGGKPSNSARSHLCAFSRGRMGRVTRAGSKQCDSIGAFLAAAWGSVQSFSVKISNKECAIPTGIAYGNDKQKQDK